MVLFELAWVTGMVDLVWMGALSIQRGTVESVFEDMMEQFASRIDINLSVSQNSGPWTRFLHLTILQLTANMYLY